MGFDCYVRRIEEKGEIIFPQKYVRTEEEAELVRQINKELPADQQRHVKSIESMKKSMTSYQFSCQHLNDPVDDDTIEFKRTWFRRFSNQDEETVTKLQNAKKTVISVDPAFRLKETHDFSGIVVTKTTEDDMVYVMEALALKVTPDKLIDKIFELDEIYKATSVKIEVVQAQILLADLVKKRAFKENTGFILDEYHPGTRETKAARIRGLIPHYANGRVIHAQGLSDLEQQLTQFPRGKHDDMIDALAAQISDWSGIKTFQEKEVKQGTGAWWKQRIRRPAHSLRDIFDDL